MRIMDTTISKRKNRHKLSYGDNNTHMKFKRIVTITMML